ncbi:MAG: D-glycero-beta-D-manno-heptose 1,7-bisphosphate 7-phosphatase [Burkholderiaceae bacterium]|jgi:D-glycero-D-manno-heptose 1,7-bisphosphate phosphatase
MSLQSAPLIILDRDGVINHDSDNYIKSPDEWRPMDRSLEAIARLTHAGWSVAVATNQSGIERGLFDISTLHAIHTKMMAAVADAGGRIDGIFFCPHAPDAGCDCRKPAAGLLRDISARFNRGLAGVPLVGDSLRDLKAGLEMDCDLWLVKTGKGARTLAAAQHDPASTLPLATRVADDLFGAVDQILKGGAAH